LNMGKMAANGPFTPIVIAMRSVVGEKKFNQIRGKGITLHSQVQREEGQRQARSTVQGSRSG
jgi:hypothetical protein